MWSGNLWTVWLVSAWPSLRACSPSLPTLKSPSPCYLVNHLIQCSLYPMLSTSTWACSIFSKFDEKFVASFFLIVATPGGVQGYVFIGLNHLSIAPIIIRRSAVLLLPGPGSCFKVISQADQNSASESQPNLSLIILTKLHHQNLD